MSVRRPILLVEDNPDDEALTVRAFQKNGIGHPIVVAHDGAEALEYLHGALPSQPQVILLDLKLPKVDGLEVLRRIRGHARTRLAPVVILTSSREVQDVSAGYRLGANSYVRKPVNFDEFLETARHLGLYWLQLNEPPETPIP